MMGKKYIPFKVKYDIEDRKKKSQTFLAKNINNVPIIIEPLHDSKIPAFDHGKFSVEREKTVYYLKSNLISKLGGEVERGGVFLFLGKKLLQDSQKKIGELYDLNH